MSTRPALFRTVPERDFLGFWADDSLRSDKVARFLDLNRGDVAKVAGVSTKSVRYDHKIPKEVLDRLTEIANICGLVAQFFEGDVPKTTVWFKTPNPMLGGSSPKDLIRFGRYEKLRRFIIDAFNESGVSPTGTQVELTLERHDEKTQASAA